MATAKKKPGRVAGEKVVSAGDFIIAYRDSKDLADLQRRLKKLADKEWTPDRIDQRIGQLRSKGIHLKTLLQLGWVEPTPGKRMDSQQLNLLLADCDKAADDSEMPRKRGSKDAPGQRRIVA